MRARLVLSLAASLVSCGFNPNHDFVAEQRQVYIDQLTSMARGIYLTLLLAKDEGTHRIDPRYDKVYETTENLARFLSHELRGFRSFDLDGSIPIHIGVALNPEAWKKVTANADALKDGTFYEINRDERHLDILAWIEHPKTAWRHSISVQADAAVTDQPDTLPNLALLKEEGYLVFSRRLGYGATAEPLIVEWKEGGKLRRATPSEGRH